MFIFSTRNSRLEL